VTDFFDDLCRTLAQPLPRRTMFRYVGRTILVSAGSTLFSGLLRASFEPVAGNVFRSPCGVRSLSSPTFGGSPCPPNSNKKCNGSDVCCGSSGDTGYCCPSTCNMCSTANPFSPGCCAGMPCGRNADDTDVNCCPSFSPQCCPGPPLHCCPANQPCCGTGCCPAPDPPFHGNCNCCTVGPKPICNCFGGDDPVYHFSGGGAFLSSLNCKTVCQCDVCGNTPVGDATFINATNNINGLGITCFNYCTRDLIQAVSFSTFQANFTGSDFQASGTGSANVNGVPTNISFSAAKISGVTAVAITNANTNQLLAGGTGESGLADFGLEILAS
jgi:hypothetical protein